MMRILITGAAGFIGSQIQDRYLSDGHEIAVVDNLHSGNAANVNPKSQFHLCDIRDVSALAKVFEDFRPEVLNLHAAQMDVRKSVEDPIYDCEVNGIGMLNLVTLAKKFKVKKIIFASSGGAVYGEQKYFPADEDHPTFPASPYGITKMLGDHYLRFYGESEGIETVSLRYANVYGPRQNPHGEAGVVAIFIAKLLKGEIPTIFGDGLQTRDFVFVEDVVQANLLALKSGVKGIYNIGMGIETNVLDLYRNIAKILGKDLEPQFAPGKPGEQRRSVISAAKISKALGWQPKFDLNQGLKKTVEYFQARQSSQP